jgi:putative ABC transport system permease protein
VDPGAARQTTPGNAIAGALDAGDAIVGIHVAANLGIADGDRMTFTGTDGTRTLTVRVNESIADGLSVLMPEADRAALAKAGSPRRAWVATVEDADPTQVVDAIGEIAAVTTDAGGNSIQVHGAAVTRAQFTRFIDTLVIIVMALLAVSVFIALIGVVNTLSLSVIERTRESALLRALGLTRGQMRGMLAIEGLVMAGVGAVLGIVLGVGFGWAGAYLVLSVSNAATIAVNPVHLVWALGIALGAGLAASVLPGRAAARAEPAAALMND